MYTYPEDIDDKLIEVVKNNEKVCKYFDIPIQHISDRVLKRMNRKTTGVDRRKTINKLRENHYKYYTEREWKDPSNYDICINSDSLGIENAANLICELVNKKVVTN